MLRCSDRMFSRLKNCRCWERVYDLVVGSLPGRMRTPRNRRQIALNLLHLSLRGERDRLELELGATAGLTC